MNRSLRAQMQGVSRQRHQVTGVGALKASTAKEKEEDLALFLEMRRRDKERNNLLLGDSRQLEQQTAETGGSPLFKAPPVRRPGADDFLNSDSDKNDYDWLLTPPGTPLFPSLETESNRVTAAPKSRLPASKSRLASTQGEPTVRPRHGGPGAALTGQRPGTPTRTGPARPARSVTPSSRPGMPSTKPASSGPRSSTPVVRSTARSSTPVVRSAARSSTPTGRPSVPQPRVASRPSTPTPRPSTPSSASSLSSLSSSSSHLKLPASAVPPRGTSTPVKSRPWKPSEMPGFSLDAPPNLRTSLPDRPVSASRGRAGAPSPAGPRPRRQSCSPARTRPSGGPPVHMSGGSIPAVKRTPSKAGNNSVSPVAMGAKMVERVINMRKLVPPPKQEDRHALHLNNARPSKSPDSSTGFGRTLSKKSFDMAIRHMDIRRSIPSNLRPLMTNIPASSIYSVRSGSMKGRSVSSPLATSSNASSELSVSNNVVGIELEDWD